MIIPRSGGDEGAGDVPLVRLIMSAWLVTAAWDGLAASLLNIIAYDVAPARLWQGVAAVALGPAAPVDADARMLAGLAVHLVVSLVWSLSFVGLVRSAPALARSIRSAGGALLVAAVVGPVIWLAMSFLLIPLATGRPGTSSLRWWVQLAAHVPFVALPLVFTTRHLLRQAAPVNLPRTSVPSA